VAKSFFPATAFFSISTTAEPLSAALMAAIKPAGPAPIMQISHFIVEILAANDTEKKQKLL
jgi:hypothetical protein